VLRSGHRVRTVRKYLWRPYLSVSFFIHSYKNDLKIRLLFKEEKTMCDEKHIVRAFDTINDMLIDRGLIQSNDRQKITEHEVKTIDENIFAMQIKGTGKDAKENCVTIWFYNHHKFSKDLFSPFIDTYTNTCDEHLIFVYKSKITTQNEKFLKKNCQGGENSKINFKKFEKFCLKNLLFNIVSHDLVPRHELLDANEAKVIYDRYSIKDNQKIIKFPLIITKTDPVAKYYDFKAGQLIKITRTSSSIGEATSFRFCV
jgi:DNA-directed RNA polymerase subunit H (RpoH/RPB5)